MNYPLISQLHITTAVIAILTGLLVLLQAKGTRRHRRLGTLYVASMVTLNISSFFIFKLTGEFSPFHVATFLSLATVIVSSAVIIMAGAMILAHNRPKLLARYGRAR